jgi:hypothetical protein
MMIRSDTADQLINAGRQISSRLSCISSHYSHAAVVQVGDARLLNQSKDARPMSLPEDLSAFRKPCWIRVSTCSKREEKPCRSHIYRIGSRPVDETKRAKSLSLVDATESIWRRSATTAHLVDHKRDASLLTHQGAYLGENYYPQWDQRLPGTHSQH